MRIGLDLEYGACSRMNKIKEAEVGEGTRSEDEDFRTDIFLFVVGKRF